MRQVDELLQQAENLATMLIQSLQQNLKRLKRDFRPDDVQSGLSGELKRVTQFYQRRLRQGVSNVEGEISRLLEANVPKRGKTPHYWRALRDVLISQSKLHSLRKRYSDDDILFILGWTFRFLRSSD